LALASKQRIDIIGAHMGRHISFQEAIDIMDKSENPMDAVNNPDLLTLLDDIDNAGVAALEKCNDDYLTSAVGLMMSNSIVKACEKEDGTVDVLKMLKLHGLMNSDDFQVMMLSAFKFAIGLSVIEELR
jgi:hypothetical protein